MLNYETGALVKSLAGHDRGRLYIIIEETEDSLFLTDGRLRPMEKPKRKKKKHVQVILKKIEDEEFTDENIRTFIKKYQSEIM
ncbi:MULTISPECIES: hypothetical protein [Sellimonas]|uniref:RNA-binding protein n=1 Tax=Sellimonas caecigallum TaxID=2592333 RepID=A0ABS7L7V9_9FIRM|nr:MULTISPECIES: hypothetical protein [Sellimonas]MBY0758867.1 hypothetical protein [Sellimonas caecigallum]OUP66821.1 hypothetical protein B5F13_02035 [Drancourtella sp. An177]